MSSAKSWGADPDVVDAACLSHDLGHPPFGHNGERALDTAAASIGGFEGNAQTLRLVTRLEPKVIGAGDVPAGLNLTRATLDAICKYPWVKSGGPDLGQVDAQVFGLPGRRARVRMDASGRAGGQALPGGPDYGPVRRYRLLGARYGGRGATRKLDPADLFDDAHCAAVIASTLDWYGPAVARSDLEDALERIVSMPVWLRSFDGSYASLAHLKDATSELIGRFCSATVAATRETFGDEPLGRYRADLVVPRQVRAEIQILKGMAVHYVMSPRETEPVYYQQRTLLADLVDACTRPGRTPWSRCSPRSGGQHRTTGCACAPSSIRSRRSRTCRRRRGTPAGAACCRRSSERDRTADVGGVGRLRLVAGLIRKDDIEAVRSAIKIDEIIGEHVALRPAGIGFPQGAVSLP